MNVYQRIAQLMPSRRPAPRTLPRCVHCNGSIVRMIDGRVLCVSCAREEYS
ncbi:MAG: hypothetical protein KGJ45_11440 [Elusimicrobia bacterium]|nr:hypothetical protein [Elusimicrobiota bacterium]